MRTLLNQLRSPLLLLLIFAAAASGLTGEWLDTGVVITLLYIGATELVKRAAYHRVEASGERNFSHVWCAKTHSGAHRF